MTRKITNIALLLVLVVFATILGSAQDPISDRAAAGISDPPLAFVGREAYEVNGAAEGTVTRSVRKLIALIKHESISVHYNPKEIGIDKSWQKASVRLFDTQGHLIAQNDQIDLAPGKSRTVSFKRNDLQPTGEKDTGRLQIEVVVTITEPKSAKRAAQFSVSLEILDSRGVSRVKWPNLVLKQG